MDRYKIEMGVGRYMDVRMWFVAKSQEAALEIFFKEYYEARSVYYGPTGRVWVKCDKVEPEPEHHSLTVCEGCFATAKYRFTYQDKAGSRRDISLCSACYSEKQVSKKIKGIAAAAGCKPRSAQWWREQARTG